MSQFANLTVWPLGLNINKSSKCIYQFTCYENATYYRLYGPLHGIGHMHFKDGWMDGWKGDTWFLHKVKRLPGTRLTPVEVCRRLAGVSAAVGTALPVGGAVAVRAAALHACGGKARGPLWGGAIPLLVRLQGQQERPAGCAFVMLLLEWQQGTMGNQVLTPIKS